MLTYTWWKKLQQSANSEAASPVNLLNLMPEDARRELAAFVAEIGEKPFRVAQITRHLWESPVADFSEITVLPAALRESLATRFRMPRLELAMRQKSLDGTEKFLFQLEDGEFIETVSIPEGSRLTLCISSQAGCALRCAAA